MPTAVFILGSHPALSAAELSSYAQRMGFLVSWDLSRFPIALFGSGSLPSPADMLPALGGTTMIGTLRKTFPSYPSAADMLDTVPEILQPRQGKRLIGLSALPCPAEPEERSGSGPAEPQSDEFSSTKRHEVRRSGAAKGDLAERVRHLALELKRAIGMKGTRVVFPPRQRPDLSTAQLLHNKLPTGGTTILLLRAPGRVDLVTIEAIQDIEAYAQRDRGRRADPGRGMLPPKVAQMLVNLSLVPPGGTIYDPFCGVGTIPMEALLLGCSVIASDASPTQVERTQENLQWLSSHRRTRHHPPQRSQNVFVRDVTRGAFPLPLQSVDAIVTEGWLGPARTSPPLPRDAGEVFEQVTELLAHLFTRARTAVRNGGRLVIAVPAFRVQKRVLRFPIDRLYARGWVAEPLVPREWRTYLLFREAARGTLLYGRPDAIVLREFIRFRKVS